MKTNIRIVGSVRGFFRHLMNDNDSSFHIIGEKSTYEIASKTKNLIAKLLRTRIVGFWGLFKINKVSEEDSNADYYLSFNRFLKTNKPYFIYLENPTALCNYSLTCIKSPFVKKKLKRCVNDPLLKKIICMSHACKDTFENVLGISIPDEKITQIYPYVPTNKLVNKSFIDQRSKQNILKLLYIAQGTRFTSKGGLEIIEAFIKSKKDYNVELTVITNIESIEPIIMQKIRDNGIKLVEFKLSYPELEKVYADHHILLQPSSDDSFGLTVLEAMHAGLAIIASDMYAFSELVLNNENGILVNPAFRFFDKNNLPNPKVWNNREKTIYSNKVNNRLVKDLYRVITYLASDRDTLNRFSHKSYERANDEFGKSTIIGKWDLLFNDEKKE